jgi:hypothetical protein
MYISPRFPLLCLTQPLDMAAVKMIDSSIVLRFPIQPEISPRGDQVHGLQSFVNREPEILKSVPHILENGLKGQVRYIWEVFERKGKLRQWIFGSPVMESPLMRKNKRSS